MLTESRICATVATADLARAKRFYAETLGLKVAYADERRGVYFSAGRDTLLNPLRARAHKVLRR